MMHVKVFAWDDSVTIEAPDGSFTASIECAGEVGMGGPTSGKLVISPAMRPVSNMMTFELCNPSMVWNDDSGLLAVPQWNRDRTQRLLIVCPPNETFQYVGDRFRVLELHSFRAGILRGIDSPMHNPREIHFEVGNLPL